MNAGPPLHDNEQENHGPNITETNQPPIYFVNKMESGELAEEIRMENPIIKSAVDSDPNLRNYAPYLFPIKINDKKTYCLRDSGANTSI